MVIRINTDILKKFGITADDFLYLYLLHATSYDLIDELDLKPNTEALQTKGLIKLGEELQDHVIRQKFLDIFQSSFDQKWSELLSHFPLKVYNKGHMRILRAKDANAKANSKARDRYKKILNDSPGIHEQVVQGLKNELELRKSTNTLGWMQMLATWINQYTWEKYEDITDDQSPERRITRQL